MCECLHVKKLTCVGAALAAPVDPVQLTERHDTVQIRRGLGRRSVYLTRRFVPTP